MLMVTFSQTEVEALCQKLGVARLSLVGSAVRPDFTPSSDVDVLVTFTGAEDRFARYFDLKDALEALFDREVDLIEAEAVTNPYIAASMKSDEVVLYAA